MVSVSPDSCDAALVIRIEASLNALARVRATTADALETSSVITAVRLMAEVLTNLDAYDVAHLLPEAPKNMLLHAIEADKGSQLRAHIDVFTTGVRQALEIKRNNPIPF